MNRIFNIRKIYIKDLSFEIPSSSKIFLKKWKPKLSLDFSFKNVFIEQFLYEVHLIVMFKMYIDNKLACIIDIEQCGIFYIKGFDKKNLKIILKGDCLNILYTYVSTYINNFLVLGGFPSIYLNPINFNNFKKK